MSATTFAKAATKTVSVRETTNGMKTLASSLYANVDLFFQIGASRGKDITNVFERAYQEDRQLALRILAWSRDVRGGAGERSTFRNLLQFIEKNHPNELAMFINAGPSYGRWDDNFVLTTPQGKKLAFDLIKEALLVRQDGLCAKWCPRKGPIAAELRAHLGLTPKGYRKTLVTLSKTVEQDMCAQNWTGINYSHVPSVAAARYQKAFGRHDTVGYGAYREALKSGTNPEVKINASAVYPYNVIQSIRSGDKDVAAAQWAALPNYIGDKLVLPMADVSGSMSCPVGGNKNLTCLDVCISLALYLADKNTGPFKDCFLTFSTNSKIEVLRGDILSKFAQLSHAQWDMSTNLEGAFTEILRVAKTNKVAEADMPKVLLIMSDMQFNAATRNQDTAFDMIRAKYAAEGYTLPSIVFWNLNAAAEQSPVTFDQKGTALISGFSPAIMTSVLAAEEIDPQSIMLKTVNAPRYMVIQ
jgi:hypothetical protein